jgi:hypothetical protein
MKKFLLAIILTLTAAPLFASPAKEAPEIILGGFVAYKEAGPKSAIEAWIKGSGIEGSKDALAQANTLLQVGEYYGKYLGFEVVRRNAISSKTNVYLITLNFERGSMFASFFTYVTPNNKEIVQTFNFNTDAYKIWPATAIYGQ